MEDGLDHLGVPWPRGHPGDWNVRHVPEAGMQQILQGCRAGLMTGAAQRGWGVGAPWGSDIWGGGSVVPRPRPSRSLWGRRPGETVFKETCFWVN